MKTHIEAMMDDAIDKAIVRTLTAKAAQLTAKVALERAKERAAIADLKAAGGFLPNDYWLERHRAEGQLRATLAMLEGFL